MNFNTVINQILLLFIFIITGYLIKRIKGLNKNTEAWIAWFVFTITLPALILSAVQDISLQDNGFKEPLILIGISIGSYILAIIIALVLP